MGAISTLVNALANNEVAVVVWSLELFMPHCAGVELANIYPDGFDRVRPAVGLGQENQ